MVVPGRRKTIAFFIALGVCLIALVVTIYVGGIFASWRRGILLVLGALFVLAIIAGVVLNTIFLIREIRRNEQHDAFINAVTHELKTPVASIRLYLETLQKRELDDGKRREFYGIMLADSDRLLSTIEQVLRAGRVSPSGRQMNLLPIDLVELANECLVLAQRRHHLPPEAFSLKASDHLSVQGDPEELKAAVSNLIDNAIKYSGPDVRVTIEVARLDSAFAAVRVTDSGVGIAKNELDRIFKRFYRVPGPVATRVKGTGLGLFIVRSVAKRHGGRAYAESAGVGQGSTFTLQLPIESRQ